VANVIFSHRRDVDGLISAAIFLRRFRDAKLNFVDYGKENVEELIKKLYALSQGDFVVIADFGLDDDYAKRLSDVLSELTKKGAIVYWLDHHNWSEQSISLVKQAGVHLLKVKDDEACGAELVHKLFGGNDKFSLTLSQIAHSTDFHLPLDEVAKTLVCVVDYYNSMEKSVCDKNLERLAQNLAEGVFLDSLIYEHFLEYKKQEEKAIEQLLKDTRTFKVNDFVVAVGFAKDPLGPTKTCDIIRENVKSDIQVYVKGKKVSFRRSNNAIDCSKIAKNLSGGGHEYAAGGELAFDAEKHRDEALEEIKKAIQKALS